MVVVEAEPVVVAGIVIVNMAGAAVAVVTELVMVAGTANYHG